MATEPVASDPYAEDLAGDSPTFVAMRWEMSRFPGIEALDADDPAKLVETLLVAFRVERTDQAEDKALGLLSCIATLCWSRHDELTAYFEKRRLARSEASS